MESSINLIKSIKNSILDILFPERCIGCHIRGNILCNNCISKIRNAERETENSIVALYDYRDPIIKRAIWKLKYHNRRHLGEKLGQLLYDGLVEDISDLKQYMGNNPIYVIAVPISPNRMKKRGYNQAEVIARNFCICGGKEVLELKKNLVIKKGETIPQAKITNRTKRLNNVHGVFGIKNPEQVVGKTIIVIDDVTTTGATLTEIIKLLKKSGAKRVVGFAVAH